MSIITLTTDMGMKDYYVPIVKGNILSHIPHTNIVDITHQIKPFDIAEASFILKNCYTSFPGGTIHLVSVESSFGGNGYVCVKVGGYYFFARDNGLLSLIIDPSEIEMIRRLPIPEGGVFPLRDVLAHGAITLLQKGEEAVGVQLDNISILTGLQPILMEDVIRGTVLYMDNFGNAVTNIAPRHLGRYGTKKAVIHYGRNNFIKKISGNYEDVPPGEAFCLFGPSGFLEIGINKGDAGQLLGLTVEHTILIEFT